MSVTALIERHGAERGLFILVVLAVVYTKGATAPASYLFTMASRQGERTSVANMRKAAPDKTGAKPKKG
jgi:hypothetical protein